MEAETDSETFCIFKVTEVKVEDYLAVRECLFNVADPLLECTKGKNNE